MNKEELMGSGYVIFSKRQRSVFIMEVIWFWWLPWRWPPEVFTKCACRERK